FVLMLLTGNPMMLPTVLLVGAAVIPLTVLLLAQSSRVGPLVPTRIVLVTAALGGLFAICAAGLEESIAGLLFGRASILLVGIIEESAKLVVPLLVLALAHRVTRGGGIVIGIAAGTGFAVLETMGYGFAALLARDGGLGALDATLILRGILVPAGHVAWTGATCAALWYLVETSHKVRGVIALVAAYAGAIILHTAWDATASGALHLLIGMISVGALLWLIVAAHRRFVRRAAPATGAGPAPESRGEVREYNPGLPGWTRVASADRGQDRAPPFGAVATTPCPAMTAEQQRTARAPRRRPSDARTPSAPRRDLPGRQDPAAGMHPRPPRPSEARPRGSTPSIRTVAPPQRTSATGAHRALRPCRTQTSRRPCADIEGEPCSTTIRTPRTDSSRIWSSSATRAPDCASSPAPPARRSTPPPGRTATSTPSSRWICPPRRTWRRRGGTPPIVTPSWRASRPESGTPRAGISEPPPLL